MTATKTGTASDTIDGAPAIAAYIGVCPHTVRRRLAKGLLPGAFRVGNQIMLSKLEYHAGVAARIAESSRRVA
ncbi:hypothetical protein DES32_1536 [Methylovirgula ligni]|uniref:Excisionase family DNA binding protein n=1 Tax=Methylovirgula ligni TaxID=569860 RepID=A0A3D9Z3J3_9HYPH|nr:hypothetical protein [Methylovirgula ligni]REF87899.1 hypothetical protein DES32_1536 [Methylovirgula ligni]